MPRKNVLKSRKSTGKHTTGVFLPQSQAADTQNYYKEFQHWRFFCGFFKILNKPYPSQNLISFTRKLDNFLFQVTLSFLQNS